MHTKLALTSALLLLAATDLADAAGKSAGKQVTVTGCPYRGVENCLFIDGPGRKVYNINSANPKPRPNYLVIRLTGTITKGGVDMCMRGTKLTNIRWSYTKRPCTPQR